MIHHYSLILVPAFAVYVKLSYAQTTARVQNNTFNSSAILSSAQISQYVLNNSWASAVDIALQFEQSNRATGSARSDPFYTVPTNSTTAVPGFPLKVDQHVNTSHFTVSPNVALSRFLFQTETFNGSAVPASAHVLWPYNPRSFDTVEKDRIPLLVWAHGTSSWWAECAPSHMRNLWYHFAGPFELALQGYAVIAPDYAGLGVDTDANGNHIPHQHICNPAPANGLAYAVQASQRTWPELSDQFVVMGHSQGGSAKSAKAGTRIFRNCCQ